MPTASGANNSGATFPPVGSLMASNGLEEILQTFGNIYDYIRPDGKLDPRWQTEFMDHAALPFPLVLSWDHSKSIRQFTCHKRLTAVFENVFANILAGELQQQIKSFGGCFAFRPERSSAKLSTHSWGIAIDLNPETNLQGSAGDMDAQVVKVFRDSGFEWGGDWPGKSRDPMHFQFCRGY